MIFYTLERVQIDTSITSPSSPNFGRLRAYINGTWGFICNDHQWSIEGNNAATVVCKQLGYNGTNHVMMPVYFHDLDSFQNAFLLHGVNCAGNESSLEECQLGDWTSENELSENFCYNLAAVLCDVNDQGIIHYIL